MLHTKTFPNESAEYREARNELLQAEIELRRQTERVAELRRSLPLGGEPREDYVFQEGLRDLSDRSGASSAVRLSELFPEGKDSLVVYSFMYGPDWEEPCPLCTSMLGSLDGNAPYIEDHAGLAVVAKAPLEKVRSWARKRGWRSLRLLSSHENDFNQDYYAETPRGQLPCLNVFVRTEQGIHHFWSAEMLFAASDEGQDNRHVDFLWPLWNVLDLIPEGRGSSWYPSNRLGEVK